jgi:hypothetical protein
MPLRRLLQLFAEMTVLVSLEYFFFDSREMAICGFVTGVCKMLRAACSKQDAAGGRRLLRRERARISSVSRSAGCQQSSTVWSRPLDARRWDGTRPVVDEGRRWWWCCLLGEAATVGAGKTQGGKVDANRAVGRNSPRLSQIQQGGISTARCLWRTLVAFWEFSVADGRNRSGQDRAPGKIAVASLEKVRFGGDHGTTGRSGNESRGAAAGLWTPVSEGTTGTGPGRARSPSILCEKLQRTHAGPGVWNP